MKEQKIYIAGHKGMVGSAIWRALENRGYSNIVGKSSAELDLRNQLQVQAFFLEEKPDIVIDAAARVGGILANSTFPYQFLMENLQMQNNLISNAIENDIEKFIFLGSSCIYPKYAPQPLREEYLLTDSLEPTNEWYAIAKIAGVKACQAIRNQFSKDYISLMPTNLYGINDNFDLNTSHVLPAMIRKFHDAKINQMDNVKLWGTGEPLREFLYVDDMAESVVFALENKLGDYLYNVGSGSEVTIKDLSLLIRNIVGYEGSIIWDSTKPDGTPRKLMDSSKLRIEGWTPKIELKEGIKRTYEWFLTNQENIKQVKIKN